MEGGKLAASAKVILSGKGKVAKKDRRNPGKILNYPLCGMKI